MSKRNKSTDQALPGVPQKSSTPGEDPHPTRETFARIREILQQARGQALLAGNAAMVRVYWDVRSWRKNSVVRRGPAMVVNWLKIWRHV